MRRIEIGERKDWRSKLQDLGFTFHSVGGTYWNESAAYEFSAPEIDHIEEVTVELHEMCLQAVQYVMGRNLFARLGIPEDIAVWVRRSWARQEPSIYGRFDLSYDGQGEPKLLEYNADTPTSLVESSLAQWTWLEDTFQDFDQFNSIHEKLTDAFTGVRNGMPLGSMMHFTCVKENEEDFVTTEYLRDVAAQAGLETKHIFIEDIGWDGTSGGFYDLETQQIRFLFKLYPWEWLLSDEFGPQVLQGTMQLYEPAWKIILSNKGILPILWEMFPEHPNLLPSSFDPSHLGRDYVRKPLLSREGANISIVEDSNLIAESSGNYGAEGFIYQASKPLPCFQGRYAVVGSWVVNGLSAGIGIREDIQPIVQNTSHFVPHYFKP
ncbi:MAG: glutathionylspermidine synthase family protein [Thermodesulfobacteriota bacterium]